MKKTDQRTGVIEEAAAKRQAPRYDERERSPQRRRR